MSTETKMLIRDGEKEGGGRGYGGEGEEGDYIPITKLSEARRGWGGGGLLGGGGGRLYTYRYTVTTRMTPALRWAAVRAIFNISLIVEVQSHKTVSTNHNF